MAISAYMWFQDTDGLYLDSESQVDFAKSAQGSGIDFPPNSNIFEVDSYSVDIVQVLNIGSQSSGAGAGKVTFDPFVSRARPTGLLRSCTRWLVRERHFDLSLWCCVNRREGILRRLFFRNSHSSWWPSSRLRGPMTRRILKRP